MVTDRILLALLVQIRIEKIFTFYLRLIVFIYYQAHKARPARKASKAREESKVNQDYQVCKDLLEKGDLKDHPGKM